MAEISVCIPTYEYKGKGVAYLSELFDSLACQTFQDFDVVISDHSQDDVIMEWCRHCNYDFDITYIRNPNGRGFQAPNTDCALENADGKILKIIYQDDIFVHDEALERIHASFTPGVKWLIHGFSHTSDGVETHRDCVPQWTDRMIEGDNLLGSPSCVAFRKGSYLGMDNDIKLLIDTELYHRQRMEFGMPKILPDILIANREHDDRVSASGVQYDAFVSDSARTWLVNKAELEYIYEKHSDFFIDKRYPDSED